MLNNTFYSYLLKFLLTFCILYYGTIAFIGITAPGGYYWRFADEYLNYVAGLRYLLLHTSRFALSIVGYETFLKDAYTIRLINGSGVHVGYDCIGYGVMFFWVAFIYANKVSLGKKIRWLTAGLLTIWIINVIRISLMLVAVNNKWKSPLNLDNHTWFNIAAYSVIFTMIYLFDRSEKKASNKEDTNNQFLAP